VIFPIGRQDRNDQQSAMADQIIANKLRNTVILLPSAGQSLATTTRQIRHP
jgi:hypothetical protein